MGSSDRHDAMTDAVARFQAEIHRLAIEIARAAVYQELARRPPTPEERKQAQRAGREPARATEPRPRASGRTAARSATREPERSTARAPARPAVREPDRGDGRPPGRKPGRKATSQLELLPEPTPEPTQGPARRTKRTPARDPGPSGAEASTERSDVDPASPAAPSAESQAVASAASDTTAEATTPPAPAPVVSGKPGAWTRERIVDELVTWMTSGTAIDAQFMTRHGPAGLVAATRRIFGRFDAALNVAAIQLSKLQPDGPTKR